MPPDKSLHRPPGDLVHFYSRTSCVAKMIVLHEMRQLPCADGLNREMATQ